MEHPYVIPKAYAYVAYGDPAREMLDLLRIEVLGPADSHEVFAKKLSNLETTWEILSWQEQKSDSEITGGNETSHLPPVSLLPSLSHPSSFHFSPV